MRPTLLLTAALITLSSFPVIAQQGAQASVAGELESKLDVRTARVGEPVVLKTTTKVTIADGTVIPRGTRLVGHVTHAQRNDGSHDESQLGIAFDRAELKSGRSVSIHSTIEAVNPRPAVAASTAMDEESIRMATGGNITGDRTLDRSTNNGRVGAGGVVGGVAAVRANVEQGSVGENINSNEAGAVYVPGANQARLLTLTRASAESATQPATQLTGIPGVVLRKSDSSSASGTLSASKKDVRLDSGTEMELSLAAANR